jgi:hypothetical protein
MAFATGGDVIVRLMAAVAELQENMRLQTQQLAGLTQGLTGLKATSKENTRQFGRVAKLLGEFAQLHDREHEELEARVERLERKASGQ